MSIDLFLRLEYVDFLIHSKTTGDPKKFSEKLNISERALYDVIRLMKDLGAPIVYSKQRKTYYYAEDGSFVLGFQKESRGVSFLSLESQLGKAMVLCLFLFDLFMDSEITVWFI
jgi:hypothetical protein